MSCGNTGEQANEQSALPGSGVAFEALDADAHVWAFHWRKGGVSVEDKDSNAQQRKGHGAAKWWLMSNPMQSASGTISDC